MAISRYYDLVFHDGTECRKLLTEEEYILAMESGVYVLPESKMSDVFNIHLISGYGMKPDGHFRSLLSSIKKSHKNSTINDW